MIRRESVIFCWFRKLTNFLSNRGLYRIPGVVPIYNYIYNILKPKGLVLISCNGSKIYVDSKDKGVSQVLLMKGIYEETETRLFKKIIKQGMVIADIGANIGYYSLLAAKLTGHKGKVFSFEPEPRNFSILRKNIMVNNYSNICAVMKGVSNKSGKTKLYFDKHYYGSCSLEKCLIEKGLPVDITTITLDEFFDELNISRLDIIKMDVEGAEGKVIDGADKILRQNNLKIVMEFFPEGLKKQGSNPLRLLKKLESYGYSLKIIDETGRGAVRKIDIEDAIEICKKKRIINLFLEK